uniref:Uncharacterized protein n=1 Tax=Setaria viridis TaxID=4556 RepID=A0A4U6UWX8_SETVI|nr:hypothetical protein SEVIR_5G259700v2 [Setaria viridis]
MPKKRKIAALQHAKIVDKTRNEYNPTKYLVQHLDLSDLTYLTLEKHQSGHPKLIQQHREISITK